MGRLVRISREVRAPGPERPCRRRSVLRPGRPGIVMQPGEAELVFLNPESHTAGAATRSWPARRDQAGCARASRRSSAPGADNPSSRRASRSRRAYAVADTLAVEVLNDRFVSAERLDFMLQELLLSIVETYLARRRTASPAWRGSRFEDSRIRRAIALCAQAEQGAQHGRAREPGGASRSRFYDLFQLCTGFRRGLSRHAVRRDRDLAPDFRPGQDLRGLGRARLLGAEQLHAFLPEPSGRTALRVSPRRHAGRFRRKSPSGV